MGRMPQSRLKGFATKLFSIAGHWIGMETVGRTRMGALFESLELGSIELPNRIVMAPLTRARAGYEAVPNELMAAYYSQRASAGMIITEATGISREGLGSPNAPGLWSFAQIDGWKRVTD